MSDRLPQNYGAELLGAEHALCRTINRDATSTTTRAVNEIGERCLIRRSVEDEL